VRAAWATVVGRILLTSAGGSGLSEHEEQSLVESLAAMLRDADEKVRVAAVDTVGQFGLSHVVHKLGMMGGCSTENSVLAILAERVKDRKPQVREHAMKILARMWAVAAGEIEQNTEPAVSLLKDAPSKIFDAFYTNDQEIHILIDRVLFETLLPLNYPPIKTKLSRSTSNQSQKQKDSQASEPDQENDVDKIRVRRILTLLRGLDEKARRVFFVMLARQLSMRSVMTLYLEACEKYNVSILIFLAVKLNSVIDMTVFRAVLSIRMKPRSRPSFPGSLTRCPRLSQMRRVPLQICGSSPRFMTVAATS
jgi:sister-chromatid-cohesion protein PDS5